ncbi:MAG: hypothetical protein JF610_07815 [Acidobacteria bacterium]|nr:hypothetical protein [Acidobacteriota bacterium]
MNLREDAEAEARRLAVVRSLDRTRHEGANDVVRTNGPLIACARGARRRKALAGRTLFIWQVACEDAGGRRSPAAIVAMLVSVANPPDAIQHVLSATQREILDSIHAHAVARLERERAMAAGVAQAPRCSAYQTGLFDQRSERNHQQRSTDAQHAEEAACGRVASASAAATITALRPTLLLVLTA